MTSETSTRRTASSPRPRARVDRRPSVAVGPRAAASGVVRSRTARTPVVRPPAEATVPRVAARESGETFLIWRCVECGAVGSLDSFPSSCPDCFAGRESLFYWTED